MDGEEQLQRRLRALFAEELDEGVQKLADGLLTMEKQAGSVPPAELVQELFRVAHSLKGAAHAAGVPAVVSVCSRMEDALGGVRDSAAAPDSATVSALLARADELAGLAGALGNADGPAARPRGSVPAQAPLGQATPAPASPAGREDIVRVRVERVDGLIRHATDALVAARRMHEAMAQAEAVAAAVEAARTRLRSPGGSAPGGAVVLDPVRGDVAGLLNEAARAVDILTRRLEATEHVLHHATGGLAEAAQQLRTQPFALACTALERAARDAAAAAGKKVHLVVDGEVEVDRSVVAALRDVLLHLVRNAVDHGIETPDVRRRAGKPEVGAVEVTAALEGGVLQVCVRDDGAGVDQDALRRVAAARGLPVSAGEEDLAFAPGLSTKAAVTAVSGRGVGLDAVRATVDRLGGGVALSSEPGHGTDVRVRVPVTLTLRRILLVRAGDQLVGLPTADLERVVEVDRSVLHNGPGRLELPLSDHPMPAVSLAQVLGFGVVPDRDAGARVGVVIGRGVPCALLCEELLDEVEAVVEPLPERLGAEPWLLGVAVLTDGPPALVVGPSALVRSGRAGHIGAAG